MGRAAGPHQPCLEGSARADSSTWGADAVDIHEKLGFLADKSYQQVKPRSGKSTDIASLALVVVHPRIPIFAS